MVDEYMNENNSNVSQEPDVDVMNELPENEEAVSRPGDVADSESEGKEVESQDVSVSDDTTPDAAGQLESRSVQRQRAVQNAARREARSARTEETLRFSEYVREAGRPLERKHVYEGLLMGVLPATDNTPTLAQVSIEDRGVPTGFDAMIQFSEFFVTDPFARRTTPMAPDERADRESRLLNNSLGARVSCVVTRAVQQGEARAIVASRKTAMQLRQRIDYFGRNPIREGSIVPANIFAVERAGHTMWVELGGVECQLMPGQITYRPIIDSDDLQEMGYVAGAQVPVYVSTLELDEDTQTVTTLHVNAATAELAKWQRNMSKLTVPMTVMGTITRLRTNPNTGITSAIVWLPHQQCPVRVPAMRTYNTNIGPGSTVTLELTRVNPDDSEGIRVYGRVRQVRPRTSMYNG